MLPVVFFSTEARVSVSDSPGCSMTPVLKDVLKCRAEAALMAVESLENLDESETEEGDTLEDDIENKFEPTEPSNLSLASELDNFRHRMQQNLSFVSKPGKISTYKMGLMTIY